MSHLLLHLYCLTAFVTAASLDRFTGVLSSDRSFSTHGADNSAHGSDLRNPLRAAA